MTSEIAYGFMTVLKERIVKDVSITMQIIRNGIRSKSKGAHEQLICHLGIYVIPEKRFVHVQAITIDELLQKLVSEALILEEDRGYVESLGELLNDRSVFEILRDKGKKALNTLAERNLDREKTDFVFIVQIMMSYHFLNGSFSEERREYHYLGIKNGEWQRNVMERNWDKFLSEIREAMADCAEKVTEKEIAFEPGAYDLVMPAGVGALFIHECLGHGVEIQNASKEASIFHRKLGEKIANEKISLIDDPTLQDHWGSLQRDDWGNEAQSVILLEKGILKNYLVDQFADDTLGMAQNSRARSENASIRPAARMTNTYLANGEDEPEAIYGSLENGIIIREMGSGKIDPLTGDVKIIVKAADYVENHVIMGRIKNFMIVTNSLEILNNTCMIGNDLKFVSGFCNSVSGKIPVSAGQPTIRINQVRCMGGVRRLQP